MKVIAHQAIGEAFRAILLESDRENHQESPPINIVDEDALLSVTARHHVIDRATEYDPMPSGHARRDTSRMPVGNPRKPEQLVLRQPVPAKFLRRSEVAGRAFFASIG
ncbi:MAG: hypothetical protein ACRD1W_08710 [Vicinamibacterales bacterium]